MSSTGAQADAGTLGSSRNIASSVRAALLWLILIVLLVYPFPWR